MSTATYTVTGMTCGHCVSSVTEEVGQIAGVTGVDVDLKTGRVTVTSDAPVDDAKVKGKRSDKAGGSFMEIAAGAGIVKAKSVTYEGESAVLAVMGGSILIVSKPAALLIGTSIKLDGECATKGALILNV